MSKIDLNKALSKDEMAALYGKFFSRSAHMKIDPKNIPNDLVPLIPYAEFWGERDDVDRDQLINDAPPDVLRNLVAAVRQHIQSLQAWLTASNPTYPSEEYVAFTNLLIVFSDPGIRKK